MAHEPVNFIVKLTDNSGRWLLSKEAQANSAIDKMAKAILGAARMRAPMSEGGGNLRNSSRIEKSHSSVSVIYGGGKVPYAAYQERGHRYDGSRQVRHYTTPNTGAHYLLDAGKRETEKGVRWLLSRS